MRFAPALLSATPRFGGPSADLLNERIAAIHREIRAHFPFVVRVAAALYDSATDEIKTFLWSPSQTPLHGYSTRLAGATWLDSLRQTRQSRVIHDLSAIDLGSSIHGRRIREAGFKSSYTVPMFDDPAFLGFVFFDADRKRAFTPRVTHQLDLFVRIISLMVENMQQTANALVGSVHLLRQVSRFRDDETASHLSRMSYYSAMIARDVAAANGHDDEWVEHVRLFAPLHDVGKIGMPDAVLLKRGPLTPGELEIMKRHPASGEAILGGLVQELSLQQVPHVRALLDIARHHHECWDGSGYPDGLRGEDIPLEARIVKVADVFDALTSRRCYKPAWPVDKAASYLAELRGSLFDPACVDLFLARLPAAREVMTSFQEESSEAT
jgi:HD-GYP domain-containing protein (c-di-GMP phosphodiesterase class II)